MEKNINIASPNWRFKGWKASSFRGPWPSRRSSPKSQLPWIPYFLE